MFWIAVMSKEEEDPNFAKANECEMRATEALDLSVRRYFAKLARDYRHLAGVARLVETRNRLEAETAFPGGIRGAAEPKVAPACWPGREWSSP